MECQTLAKTSSQSGRMSNIKESCSSKEECTRFESPRSLTELCIDFICDNVSILCKVQYYNASKEVTKECHPNTCSQKVSCKDSKDSMDIPSAATTAQTPNNGSVVIETRLSFMHPDTFLPAEISEQLLYGLCEKKMLSDLSITLFNYKSTRLRHVRLSDASSLTEKGLRVLKQHKIVDLVVNRSAVTVNDLINCLGDWSLQNLRTLSVGMGSFMDCSRNCVIVTLSKLRSLRILNVSGTEFNKHGLEIVVEDLPLLENLDISCTRVDDITPLTKCKDRLRTLNMYNLKLNRGISLTSVLLELNELRTLDISGEKYTHAFEVFSPAKQKVTEFLKAVHCMPHLTNLDLSGTDDVEPMDLRKFVKTHPNLMFVGLVGSDACHDDSLTNPDHVDYRPGLVVSGTATESQILEALRRYTSRAMYIRTCLSSLLHLMPSFLEPRVDIIKLLLSGMKEHPLESRMQIIATACLYTLTKDDLAVLIHPSILKQIVERILVEMEIFPRVLNLQRNILLTLGSNRILEDVAFDRYKCARLVMNSLTAFDDPFLNRVSVAIYSVLAGKISTFETTMLFDTQPRYMSKLLELIKAKVESKSADLTMRFTLTALWSSTDDNATTCKAFLDRGGMELFLDVLEGFQGEFHVETKVLGLLNNIAEVVYLRERLVQPRFMSMLSVLLDSSHIDISYFAAGIAANLLNHDPDIWSTKESLPTREQLLEQLDRAVSNWQTPQREIVAYRSLQPFFPLLMCSDVLPVQLWALWAIHYVCTKNPKRYSSMLINEGGIETLRSLENSGEDRATLPNKSSLCRAILATLESNS